MNITISQYLLESTICLLVFYSFYYLALRKETFFQLNRFYLLFAPLVSLILPAISFHINVENHINNFVLEPVLPVIQEYNMKYASVMSGIDKPFFSFISVGYLIELAYKLGAFLFGLKLLSGLFKMHDLIKKSNKEIGDGCQFIRPQNKGIMASSFFSYIFWNGEESEKSKIILEHEMVHVRQWHSLDVILMELMVVVKWFNPLIYAFKNSLRKTHEYIADSYVSQKMNDVHGYAQIILNENKKSISPYSNTIFSFIKDRLVMLNRKQSRHISLFKYILTIPILAVLLALFSFNLSDELPDTVKQPFSKLESKINEISNTNVLALFDQEETNIQYSWGNFLRVILDEENNFTQLELKLHLLNLKKIFEELPVVTNIESELYYSPFKIFYKDHVEEYPITEFLNKDLLNELESKADDIEKMEIQSEFYYKGQMHSQLLNIIPVSYKYTTHNDYYTFEWGQKSITNDVTFPENVNNILWNDFFIKSKSMVRNSDGSINFVFQRFDTGVATYLETPSNFVELINETIFYVTSEGDKNKLPGETVLNLEVTKSSLENLNSLDLSNNYYLDIPEALSKNVRIIPVVNIDGSHSVLHRLRTTYSDLKRNSELQLWLKALRQEDKVRMEFSKFNGDQIKTIFFIISELEDVKPVKLKMPVSQNEFFNFQIQINRSGKSYVKLDTTIESNKSILKSYSRSDSYEVIHIKGFETKYRVIDSEFENIIAETMNEMNSSDSKISSLNLKEYYPESSENISLNWGNMFSKKLIGSFSFNEFLRSKSSEFKLMEGDEEYDIINYDIIVPEGSDIYRKYHTDSNAYFKIKNSLNELRPGSTVYVENIIINKDDQFVALPIRFSFTFE